MKTCPQCGQPFFLGARAKDGTELCDATCRIGWTRKASAPPPPPAPPPPRPPAPQPPPAQPAAIPPAAAEGDAPAAWSPVPELAFYIAADATWETGPLGHHPERAPGARPPTGG